MSLANIALRKNAMTIKQVAQVLDELEASPKKTFDQIAVEMDILDQADMMQLIRHQQMSCTPIRKLVAECGLLTERQAAVLFNHFEKSPTATPMETPTAAPAPAPATPAPAPAPSTPVQSKPRVPKFKSRPVIMRPYSTS